MAATKKFEFTVYNTTLDRLINFGIELKDTSLYSFRTNLYEPDNDWTTPNKVPSPMNQLNYSEVYVVARVADFLRTHVEQICREKLFIIPRAHFLDDVVRGLKTEEAKAQDTATHPHLLGHFAVSFLLPVTPDQNLKGIMTFNKCEFFIKGGFAPADDKEEVFGIMGPEDFKKLKSVNSLERAFIPGALASGPRASLEDIRTSFYYYFRTYSPFYSNVSEKALIAMLDHFFTGEKRDWKSHEVYNFFVEQPDKVKAFRDTWRQQREAKEKQEAKDEARLLRLQEERKLAKELKDKRDAPILAVKAKADEKIKEAQAEWSAKLKATKNKEEREKLSAERDESIKKLREKKHQLVEKATKDLRAKEKEEKKKAKVTKAKKKNQSPASESGSEDDDDDDDEEEEEDGDGDYEEQSDEPCRLRRKVQAKRDYQVHEVSVPFNKSPTSLCMWENDIWMVSLYSKVIVSSRAHPEEKQREIERIFGFTEEFQWKVEPAPEEGFEEL